MVEEIAHQFRNPLSSVGGYAKRILKGSLSSPKTKAYLENLMQETGRMETVLQRVEELVRVPRPAFRRETIQAIAEAAESILSPKADEQEVTLRVNTRELKGEGIFFADRQLLIRTLDQILENSCEAILQKPVKARKKVIDLSVLDDGENVGIAVTDWGQGISKKNMGLIFDPFFTTRPKRVGLGLTFVWRVIEEHGGAVRVNSILNRGTTITLTFPKDRRRKVRREWLSPEAAALRNT
jgi:signal transduction histidine kinase